ncbi:hypothetical protein HPHPH4_1438 [Helicobacter pylori Hp H-4]|nr:hypothetical protein HPHPH4_1438 [Helicobacter pylori Hp H-4]
MALKKAMGRFLEHSIWHKIKASVLKDEGKFLIKGSLG